MVADLSFGRRKSTAVCWTGLVNSEDLTVVDSAKRASPIKVFGRE